MCYVPIAALCTRTVKVSAGGAVMTAGTCSSIGTGATSLTGTCQMGCGALSFRRTGMYSDVMVDEYDRLNCYTCAHLRAYLARSGDPIEECVLGENGCHWEQAPGPPIEEKGPLWKPAPPSDNHISEGDIPF